jgi:flagellar L-ring protein precursor FlgH
MYATNAVPVPVMPYPQTQQSAPGSLWVDTQARMIAGLDGNARAEGDLVTVLITESSRTSITAGTSSTSTSDNEAEVRTLFGLGKKITDSNPNMGGSIGMGAGSNFTYNGDGTTSREGQVEAVLTCTVQQVLPNGNLFISGTKEVRTNNETQYVTLSGFIRPQDIQANNTVESGRIANPSIQIHGQGVLADDQRTRAGTRVMKRLWPF